MTEIIEPADAHKITLRELLNLVSARGGDMNTPLLIEADGEPVYINFYQDIYDRPAERAIAEAMAEADIDGFGTEGEGYDFTIFVEQLTARGWTFGGTRK